MHLFQSVNSAPSFRDEVRDQHVKPPVIVTDQYGRRYLTKVENGETIYYADPHTQDTTAEQSEQRLVLDVKLRVPF
ncbi:hypothetical protein ANCCAN_27782 [Ancylostoma caninum]|uniref:Uncharacterized protein n=1 Tax=Ancylostoma caninum TaxID=29170 RepID=A0A368F322_ANCCA|nr:hypothetical protein ANCCAN_27782 [Ancylostoma caninum]